MIKDHPLPVVTPDGRPAADLPKWRRDFPVDVDEDNHVARRDFTRLLILISFAFVVGQLWIWLKSAWRGSRSRPAPLRITGARELPVGGALSFQYPGAHDPCVLVHTAPEQFVAYSSRCTHLSCAVLPDAATGTLRCPCHHGLFDLESGRPLAGPPRRPLARIRLRVENGAILAVGVEERTT